MKYLLYIFITGLISVDFQTVFAQSGNDPGGAFLRSMVVPGWGHYYNDRDDWNRGKIHLTTDLAVIAAYAGFQYRSSTLKNDYETLAKLRSGIDVKGRSRSFQIALAEFPSLKSYNDFQLRSRNWDRLLEENSANNWWWQSDGDRLKYGELRSRRDRIRSQLPAFFGLMIINRVVSAISAYNIATYSKHDIEVSLLPIYMSDGANGAITKISYRF